MKPQARPGTYDVRVRLCLREAETFENGGQSVFAVPLSIPATDIGSAGPVPLTLSNKIS